MVVPRTNVHVNTTLTQYASSDRDTELGSLTVHVNYVVLLHPGKGTLNWVVDSTINLNLVTLSKVVLHIRYAHFCCVWHCTSIHLYLLGLCLHVWGSECVCPEWGQHVLDKQDESKFSPTVHTDLIPNAVVNENGPAVYTEIA